MRPYIPRRHVIARNFGLFTRQIGNQAIATEKISIVSSSKTSKELVIKNLERHLADRPKKYVHTSISGHGAAIFASQDFASWLRDETFMSNVLRALFKSNIAGESNSQDVNVLCAVTDGLAPKRLLGQPEPGFSILYGSSNDILPGLWDQDEFGSNVDEDRESSVSFQSTPLPGDTRPLEITFPLANTVFQNGRRSTLFASKWQASHDMSMVHTSIQEKRTQRIRAHATSAGHTYPFLPLLPLTPPRKIVAGLGNIVRQVEVNGSTAPASKELEGLIPKIFDARSQRNPDFSPGPIGVWCLVIPSHVVERYNLGDIKVFKPESSGSEAELSVETMNMFSELMSSGCRLHKILSGGGGWGLKQGLLSLDPETNYSLPGQDDVEMFIKAFHERNSPDSSEGLVTPGSYLMFCIEPHCTEKEIRESQQMNPTTVVGVTSDNDQVLNYSGPTDHIEIIDDHFGIVSKAGVFLKATSLPHMVDVSNRNTKQTQAFTTKVDFPRASFVL
ncbi:uncharacterized protein F4822DRAFT_320273 [Hypoxylon trugodes]|uniref:uncharacterized protein n=1 Tax=Hypoxylon trugodes TaxID=326681 RepID=UPI002190CD83|nr:uncharacterized protein F4822DRAFT_320273 [Hypoxylon trugodes]KAI1386572.1 hypothetical protein F4822DRAFT_320273 [Hypoxylon trugodes]